MEILTYFALGVFLMTSFDVCSTNDLFSYDRELTPKPLFPSTVSSYRGGKGRTLRVVSSTPEPFMGYTHSTKISSKMNVPRYASANNKRPYGAVLLYTPKPHITYQVSSYMTAPNLHECVPCHADDQARKDFDSCLISLPRKLQETMRGCCENEFGIDTCKNITSGGTDYDEICNNPEKGLHVERCFWYEARADHVDTTSYMLCKEDIFDKYCAEGSSSTKMTGVMIWMIPLLLIWLS